MQFSVIFFFQKALFNNMYIVLISNFFRQPL